jgi:hypothetical protein
MTTTWSWVRAFEEGTLTALQFETLQALVDDGEVESLAEAARLMDSDVADRADVDADVDTEAGQPLL